MGAKAIQVHPTPPNYWGSPKLDEERIARFKAAADEAGHPPFFFHAVYLINLDGVIFHTGSHKGAGFEACLPTIVGHLTRVIQRADPQRAQLLIENNAGMGGCVGARFEEIRVLLDAVSDPRVRACFDTCHAFASGYDERTIETARATVDEWDRVVGLDNLVAVHCNDSQMALGSNRDRHANIGQ